MCQRPSNALSTGPKEEIEPPCDHEGYVWRGRCERCGQAGLESDDETYKIEAPK